jgi:putative NADH-flavin reductase
MYNSFLVVGATGGSGKEIINQLLSLNKKVTIIVRNKTKAKTFLKQDYEKISNIIEVELGNGEAILNQELAKAIRETDCLISALGTTFGQNPKNCDYDSIKELIEISERENLKKFVFITSLYITRPLSFVAYLLNNVIPFVLGWKSLAENKLRKSKLDYMIVRPGELTNKIDNESKN